MIKKQTRSSENVDCTNSHNRIKGGGDVSITNARFVSWCCHTTNKASVYSYTTIPIVATFLLLKKNENDGRCKRQKGMSHEPCLMSDDCGWSVPVSLRVSSSF